MYREGGKEKRTGEKSDRREEEKKKGWIRLKEEIIALEEDGEWILEEDELNDQKRDDEVDKDMRDENVVKDDQDDENMGGDLKRDGGTRMTVDEGIEVDGDEIKRDERDGVTDDD